MKERLIAALLITLSAINVLAEVTVVDENNEAANVNNPSMVTNDTVIEDDRVQTNEDSMLYLWLWNSYYTVTVESGLGLTIGESEEIVYKNSSSNEKLSQLLWDMKPLLYYKTALTFEQIDKKQAIGLFCGVSMKYGISGDTGQMQDTDWDYTDGNRIRYSTHNNNTKDAMQLDFSIGVSLPIHSKWVLKPGIRISYMSFKWMAYNGKIESSKTPPPNPYYYGPVIFYDQEWLMFYLGLKADFQIVEKLNLQAGVFISPYNIAAARDDHILTGRQYDDYPRGGFGIDPELSIHFTPYRRITFSLQTACRFVFGLRGATREKNTLTDQVAGAYDNKVGAGYQVFDIGLSATFRL